MQCSVKMFFFHKENLSAAKMGNDRNCGHLLSLTVPSKSSPIALTSHQARLLNFDWNFMHDILNVIHLSTTMDNWKIKSTLKLVSFPFHPEMACLWKSNWWHSRVTSTACMYIHKHQSFNLYERKKTTRDNKNEKLFPFRECLHGLYVVLCAHL